MGDHRDDDGIETVSASDALSPERFHSRLFTSPTPLVVKDLVSSWPAFDEWPDLDRLRSRIGSKHVKVQRLKPGRPVEFAQLVEMTFDAFAETLVGSRDWYLTKGCIIARGAGGVERDAQLPELAGDFHVPSPIGARELREVNLWIGPGGNRSCLHFDHQDNLLCVLQGEKRVRLYAPSESRRIYRFSMLAWVPEVPGENKLLRHHPPDPENVDRARFPRFDRARSVTVTLRRGDALFVPSGYWHYVQSFGRNVALNFWWACPKNLVLRNPERTEYLIGLQSRIRRKVWSLAGRASCAAPRRTEPRGEQTRSARRWRASLAAAVGSFPPPNDRDGHDAASAIVRGVGSGSMCPLGPALADCPRGRKGAWRIPPLAILG